LIVEWLSELGFDSFDFGQFIYEKMAEFMAAASDGAAESMPRQGAVSRVCVPFDVSTAPALFCEP
jgi:hypothetical protein